MIQGILLMTKSIMIGGYCVTGLNISNGEWIRLVVKNEESFPRNKLRYPDNSIPELLDVMMIDLGDPCGTKLHPEDYYREGKILANYSNSIEKKEIIRMLEERAQKDKEKHPFIFYNNSCKLLADDFPDVGEEGNYSLHLVELEKMYERRTGFEKLVADIEYNGESYYGLRITDEEYCHSSDKKMRCNKKKFYIVVSLGKKFLNGYNNKYEHYKLVASVLDV